jgi:hypothetical protein
MENTEKEPRKKCTREFKLAAGRMREAGSGQIWKWWRGSVNSDARAFPGSGTSRHKESVRLRKAVASLRQGRKILPKAGAMFSGPLGRDIVAGRIIEGNTAWRADHGDPAVREVPRYHCFFHPGGWQARHRCRPGKPAPGQPPESNRLGNEITGWPLMRFERDDYLPVSSMQPRRTSGGVWKNAGSRRRSS